MGELSKIKLIECPRDAMQGIKEFISTENKIKYINSLLKIGFDTIDFGSFVSPAAVPQMRDTAEVLAGLNLDTTSSKLLAIVANQRGGNDAAAFEQITYLGFPLSLSETFQQKNTNKSIEEAFKVVEDLQSICVKSNKYLVVYLSMGFGNPYGDPYNAEYVIDFTRKLYAIGVRIISLSDTIGVSEKENITYLFKHLIPELPDVEFGAHLHSTPDKIIDKLSAAYHAGCKRFDGAIKGWGGCPMAKDELTGNMATEVMISYFDHHQIELNLNREKLSDSMQIASEIFPE